MRPSGNSPGGCLCGDHCLRCSDMDHVYFEIPFGKSIAALTAPAGAVTAVFARKQASGRAEPIDTEPSPISEQGPFDGFSAAAAAALHLLSQRSPEMDLWLVTCVNHDSQHVIASAGRWAQDVQPGMRFPWRSSFCIGMVTGQGPTLAADITQVPAYRQAAVGPLARVRSYLGVPLILGEDALFGTLCAFSGAVQSEALSRHLPLVRLTGRMLSSLITAEGAVHDRAADAAKAYELAERDASTGLRNQRGFEAISESEDSRCRLFGSHASVVLVEFESSVGEVDLTRCAELVSVLCRECDTVSRLDGHRVAILAVETDIVGARALGVRLRKALRVANFSVSIGVASRRAGERLADTAVRADEALRLDHRRHTRLRQILGQARGTHT
jgi:GGDEF domain-containing protein